MVVCDAVVEFMSYLLERENYKVCCNRIHGKSTRRGMYRKDIIIGFKMHI